MLTKTLQKLIDEQHTTAREIGELAGVSTSTVYRWIGGQSRPDFDSIRLLVRHLPKREAQEAILSVFAAGTAWQFEHNDLELDVNHDGSVNADDALDASVQAVRTAAESLANIRASMNGKEPSSDETLQIVALLGGVIRHCTITQRVMVEMAEQRRKRKLRLAK